jgi:hypothetical protein
MSAIGQTIFFLPKNIIIRKTNSFTFGFELICIVKKEERKTKGKVKEGEGFVYRLVGDAISGKRIYNSISVPPNLHGEGWGVGGGADDVTMLSKDNH